MKKFAIAATLSLCAALAFAQSAPPAPQPVRLRGTIESVEAASMTLKERSGEVVRLALDDRLVVNEVLPIELSALRPGAYVGTAAMPRPDGSLEAIEVLVFPESARGTGEGHRAYDLRPGSTMTNATVADLAAAPQGRRLTLSYKDGTKTLHVPEATPVVTFRPADRSLLVAGARVVVSAELRDGKPTALRVLAGRDGYAPPL